MQVMSDRLKKSVTCLLIRPDFFSTANGQNLCEWCQGTRDYRISPAAARLSTCRHSSTLSSSACNQPRKQSESQYRRSNLNQRSSISQIHRRGSAISRRRETSQFRQLIRVGESNFSMRTHAFAFSKFFWHNTLHVFGFINQSASRRVRLTGASLQRLCRSNRFSKQTCRRWSDCATLFRTQQSCRRPPESADFPLHI